MQVGSKTASSTCSSGEADERHAAPVELRELPVDGSVATISQTGCFVNCRWLQGCVSKVSVTLCGRPMGNLQQPT